MNIPWIKIFMKDFEDFQKIFFNIFGFFANYATEFLTTHYIHSALFFLAKLATHTLKKLYGRVVRVVWISSQNQEQVLLFCLLLYAFI